MMQLIQLNKFQILLLAIIVGICTSCDLHLHNYPSELHFGSGGGIMKINGEPYDGFAFSEDGSILGEYVFEERIVELPQKGSDMSYRVDSVYFTSEWVTIGALYRRDFEGGVLRLGHPDNTDFSILIAPNTSGTARSRYIGIIGCYPGDDCTQYIKITQS